MITLKWSKKLMFLFCLASIPFITASNAIANPDKLVSDLDLPWSLEFVSSDEVLISSRRGRIERVNLATGDRTEIVGVWPVWFSGQGGLLDLALHPDYDENRWVYATFSKDSDEGAGLALARFQIENDQVNQLELLFESNARSSGGRHFGSRIVFDSDGFVYFTSGDRGERDWSQELANHAGTVMRLHDDGRIPADNPFVAQANAMPEIWSYGHRNPQGIAYDPATNRVWVIEHGPRGGDEINLVKKAANYGWPVISYGKEYWGPFDVGEGTHKEGMEQPVKVYDPSIAPGSLALFEGRLFSGALKLRHLNMVALNEAGEAIAEQRLLEALEERIRDVVVGPDKALYLVTDQGNLYRYAPKL